MGTTAEQIVDDLRKQMGEDGIEQLMACKSDEEKMRLLSEHGVELSDELLEGVAGGGFFDLLKQLAREAWEEIYG